MGLLGTASIVSTIVAVGLVLLIRRNLRQREIARRFRQIFISIADDLVGKPEFPAEHARQLVLMSAIPEGWVTRFMVAQTMKHMFFGVSERRRSATSPTVEGVPANLRALYVTAIFAFLLSDTYRCALLGRVVRSTVPWLGDAIKEIKPDVNAHATRTIVEQVSRVHPPKRFEDAEMACFA